MPADGSAEARSVAADLWSVVGSNERGIDLDIDIDPRQCAETIDHLPYRHGLPGCDVVHELVARQSGCRDALDEEAVRANDVPNVADIPADVHVAGSDHVMPILLGGHDPGRERRHNEIRALARPGVVERPGDDHGDPKRLGRLEGRLLLRQF